MLDLCRVTLDVKKFLESNEVKIRRVRNKIIGENIRFCIKDTDGHRLDSPVKGYLDLIHTFDVRMFNTPVSEYQKFMVQSDLVIIDLDVCKIRYISRKFKEYNESFNNWRQICI